MLVLTVPLTLNGSTVLTSNVVDGHLLHGLGKIELAHAETTFLRANSSFFVQVFFLHSLKLT